jgi:hypothetical protein
VVLAPTLQSVKRKLEVESNATERVEGSVKDAEDHLNAKDYDLQQMLQQLEALKCKDEPYCFSFGLYEGLLMRKHERCVTRLPREFLGRLLPTPYAASCMPARLPFE